DAVEQSAPAVGPAAGKLQRVGQVSAAELLELRLTLRPVHVDPDQAGDRPQGNADVGEGPALPPAANLVLGGQAGLELGRVDERRLAGRGALLDVLAANADMIRRAKWQNRPTAGQVIECGLEAGAALGATPGEVVVRVGIDNSGGIRQDV